MREFVSVEAIRSKNNSKRFLIRIKENLCREVREFGILSDIPTYISCGANTSSAVVRAEDSVMVQVFNLSPIYSMVFLTKLKIIWSLNLVVISRT